MNEMEIKAKAQELAQDTEWMQKLSAAESTEEAAELFAQKGVEVTAQELDQLVAQMDNKELNAEDLDNVAGGAFPILLGVGVMVAASVVAYGGAFAMSKFTASWNKKKKKK